MKVPWRRKKVDSVPEPQPDKVPANWTVNDMTFDEQVVATFNVMAIRDAINVFLSLVRDHRDDDHDCPPYCVPQQLSDYLMALDDDDLRMILTVMLKDMVDMYLRQLQDDT